MTKLASLNSLQLPLSFDVARLRAELEQIAPDDWAAHFNSSYYLGEWSGVALRSAGGGVAQLYADPAAQSFADTPLLSRCPYWRHVLAMFECPLRSVRLLKLRAGSSILEHRDLDLGLDIGEIRLHVPIVTNPGVEFFLDGHQIVLNEGECWYLNLNLPHRVTNHGESDRIHLVIDCEVNDWMRSMIESSQMKQETDRSSEHRYVDRPPHSGAGLQEFCELALQDLRLQQILKDLADTEAFSRLTEQLGQERGYRFTAADVRSAIRSERACVVRADAPMIPPSSGWIPMSIQSQDTEPTVDWCYLGDRRFTAPFFQLTIQECLRHPFSALFRHQTPIDALVEWQAIQPGLKPTGFIFHMSRCGSTLVSQMLASLPQNVVISEAGPIDEVLRASSRHPALPEAQRRAWFRAVVSALGQPRQGLETNYFIKFDCWNTLDLAFIRRAFPEVPWIFVYRDPVEVLVSQILGPGRWTLPGAIDPGLLGLEHADVIAMPREEYCARLLGTFCAAILEADGHGGRMVNYLQLPDIVWSSLPGLFHMPCSEEDIERMRHVTQFDAKTPSLPFVSDAAAKNRNATDRIRQAADRWLSPLYERLEHARCAQGEASSV